MNKIMKTGMSAAVLAVGVTGLTAFSTVKTAAFAQQVVGPKVTWLVSLYGPRRGQTEGLEYLASQLAERTGGNFTLDLRYGEALSGPRENLQGIRNAAFEMAMFCTAYDPGKTPAASGLELPFRPASNFLERAEWEDNYINHPVVIDELARWNAFPILMGTMPADGLMVDGPAPTSLKELNGVRLMATANQQKVLGEYGAVVTTIPSVELYQAMERDVVDGVVFPWTYGFFTYRIDELSKWYNVNFASMMGGNACPIIANTAAYQSLPQEYKDLLVELKPGAYKAMDAAYADADAKNMEIAKERGLVEVVFSDEELAAAKAGQKEKLWSEWSAARAAEGLPADELTSVLEAPVSGKFAAN